MNDSLMNKMTAFFWDMFCLNIIFIASNALLIGVLLFVVFHWITLPVYLLAFFLFIVSFQVMLLTIKRFEKPEDTSIFKQYVCTYRQEFNNSCKIATYYLVITIILGIGYMGTQFIVTNRALFTATYLLLFALLYAHFIFSLLIRINFIIDTKGTLRLGLYCISKYSFYSLVILGKSLILGLVIPVIPTLLFLGIIPVFGYSLIKMTRKVFEEVKVVLNV